MERWAKMETGVPNKAIVAAHVVMQTPNVYEVIGGSSQ
jgi:hypothetical protein